MEGNALGLFSFPEWYRVEKDTEATIKKLTTLKELSFYLSNQDEYIRRLAILRLSELKLKDSIEALKEILDDRLESPGNKDLAAWTIKSISVKWDIDLFISNKYLSKYTGKERYNDLYVVNVIDSLPSIRFEFSSSLINEELQSGKETVRQGREIDFEISFSYKEWFKHWFSNFYSEAGKHIICLPVLIIKAIKILLSSIFKLLFGIFKSIINLIKKLIANYKSRTRISNKYGDYYRRQTIKTINPLTLLKRAFIALLYLLFSPVRLLMRHKWFSLCTLLLFYFFLTFTNSGKIITYRYFNADLSEIQMNAYNSLKEIGLYARGEINDILGTGNKKRIGEPPEAVPEIRQIKAKQYRITAEAGLNIRKEPSGTADKAAEKILEYNSIVISLSKKQQDVGGNWWYLIKTQDGKTGWVFSRWLEELGGNGNE